MSESEHAEDVNNWKNKRVSNLTSENGWLTLCGLFWLKDGKNRVGYENENEVILPKSGNYIADILVNDGSATLEVVSGHELFIVSGKSKTLVTAPTTLQHDDDGKQDSTLIQVDNTSVTFYVIKRGAKLAVRVKDSQNEARTQFKGLTYFPLSYSARVIATYHPYTPHKPLSIKTVLDMESGEVSPGYLEFEWSDGKTYKLDTIVENPTDKDFFILLKDKTSGKDTYGMRYLLVPIPPCYFSGGSKDDNKTAIDFNKLYNPPCVFTNFATCPLPPQQNILPFRIEAGELAYGGHF